MVPELDKHGACLVKALDALLPSGSCLLDWGHGG